MLATPVILRYPDHLSLSRLIPLTLPSSYSYMDPHRAPFRGTGIGRTRSQMGPVTLPSVFEVVLDLALVAITDPRLVHTQGAPHLGPSHREDPRDVGRIPIILRSRLG